MLTYSDTVFHTTFWSYTSKHPLMETLIRDSAILHPLTVGVSFWIGVGEVTLSLGRENYSVHDTPRVVCVGAADRKSNRTTPSIAS